MSGRDEDGFAAGDEAEVAEVGPPAAADTREVVVVLGEGFSVLILKGDGEGHAGGGAAPVVVEAFELVADDGGGGGAGGEDLEIDVEVLKSAVEVDDAISGGEGEFAAAIFEGE